MDKSLYKEHYELEDRHWWFVGRRAIIRAVLLMLPRGVGHVLDIGCGTGRNALLLRNFAKSVMGTEDTDEAIQLAREKNAWLPVTKGSLPEVLVAGTFDLVAMFDVLEHVQDDRMALRNIREKLNSGGYILLTVPAYRMLWSEHDELAHHKRRYTKGELERVVRDAGFTVLRASYFNTLLFLPILAIRFVKRVFGIRSGASDFFMPPALLNSILVGLFSFEAFLLRYINLPFGVSLLCLAKK